MLRRKLILLSLTFFRHLIVATCRKRLARYARSRQHPHRSQKGIGCEQHYCHRCYPP